jgi:hypothetical protein
MEKKAVLNNMRDKAGAALSKLISKIDLASKMAACSWKINSLKAKVRHQKIQIGNYVLTNKAEFEKYDELNIGIQKIEDFQNQIEQQRQELTDLKND